MLFSRIRPIVFTVLTLVGFFCCLSTASASGSMWAILYPAQDAPVFTYFGSKHYTVVNPEIDRLFQHKGSTNWVAAHQLEIEDLGIEKGVSSENLGVYVGLAQGGTVLIKADLTTHEQLATLPMPEGRTGQMIVGVKDDAAILSDGQAWRVVSMASFDRVTLLDCPGLEQGHLCAMASYDQYLALMSGTNVLSILRLDDTGYAL